MKVTIKLDMTGDTQGVDKFLQQLSDDMFDYVAQHGYVLKSVNRDITFDEGENTPVTMQPTPIEPVVAEMQPTEQQVAMEKLKRLQEKYSHKKKEESLKTKKEGIRFNTKKLVFLTDEEVKIKDVLNNPSLIVAKSSPQELKMFLDTIKIWLDDGWDSVKAYHPFEIIPIWNANKEESIKENNDIENLLQEIKNDLRGEKNKWVHKAYNFKDKEIQTKRFNNWFQIFRIDGTNYHMTMDMTQGAVLSRIREILMGLDEQKESLKETNCAKCRVNLDNNIQYERKNGLIYCKDCAAKHDTEKREESVKTKLAKIKEANEPKMVDALAQPKESEEKQTLAKIWEEAQAKNEHRLNAINYFTTTASAQQYPDEEVQAFLKKEVWDKETKTTLNN